ncbi:MAG: hemolysin family protein [Gemmatimonadaceae bacterium]
MALRLLGIAVLVLLNGFFVAAEFALVRSRRTRLEARIRRGDPKARYAVRALAALPRVLSASQFGVTLASLGLGWAAERTLHGPLEQLIGVLPLDIDVPLRVTLAAAFALGTVTYLHVVFGELTPKAATLASPEMWASWLAPPLLVFAWIAMPFTWLLNRSSQLVLASFRLAPPGDADSVHSPEELRMLVEQSQEEGVLEPQDADLIEGVFEFSEKTAREVMTPRTSIVALPVDATLDDALTVADESELSRFPVYEGTVDNIIGLVLSKELLTVLRRRVAVPDATEEFSLRSIMRDVHVVPGSRKVEEVLADFKRLKEHLAIVLDEYGGTAGLVTMEDLLEEIVGEILDEYDEPERSLRPATAGEVIVAGTTEVADVNERFALHLPTDDFTTIGGLVFGALGRLPVVGDRVVVGGASMTVREMYGRRVGALAIDPTAVVVPEHAATDTSEGHIVD